MPRQAPHACGTLHRVSLERLGRTTAGVWTRREALALASAAQVRRLVLSGVWQSPWPGVYADAGHDLDPEQRAFAAVIAGGSLELTVAGRRRVRAAACGRTAARVHGLVLVDDDDPATGSVERQHDDVTCWTHSRAARQGHDGRVLHRRQLTLQRGDVVRSPSGLWLTSVPRTVLDCAGLLSHEGLVCLLDDASRRQLLSSADLEMMLSQRNGPPGMTALRRAARVCDARAESPAESLARLLLQPHLPGLVPQVELHHGHGGVLARFDLAVERQRLAVELDGRRGHAGEAMLAKDRRRDRRTAALGWRTERGTWFDVRRRQAEFVERVVSAARGRAA